ncbi:MAG: hypothetical protein A3F72_10910 [Bacteroidetes bacterium RIFCSPLOWO2_12_FULL_35_15]|nr:MAG: hypothetical protein A3F72_10910 [Bacteroidetes bacterium RIFCSPLOWO2_12_FULL_35_15]
MNKLFHAFLLVFFALIIQQKLEAQYNGYPIRNYTSKENKGFTQNWVCVQDKRGVLYFGNSSVILEYDGKVWRKIPVTSSVAIRSLYIDSLGTIYVGSVGDFGLLVPQKNGELVFQSLTKGLTEKEKNFSDVWKIHNNKGAVIFQSSENLFFLKDNKITTISPEFSFASLSFIANDDFYIRQRMVGLMKLEGNKLHLIPEGEKLKDDGILGVIPFPKHSKNKYLVLTGDNGFFLIDDIKKNITPVLSTSAKQLNDIGVLGMNWFNDSTIFINSRGGIISLNQKLELQKIINKSDGLNDESIANMFVDKQKELWLCTNNGISKISINSPLYFYNNSSGLKGNIFKISIYNNKIFVGTTAGIFQAELNNQNKSSTAEKLIFKNIEGTYFEVWDFNQNKNQLLAATSDGVFEIANNKANRITKAYSNIIFNSVNSENRMYVGEKDGLKILEKNKSLKWEVKHFLDFPTDDIVSIVEIPNDSIDPKEVVLWMTTRNKGAMKVSFDGTFNYKLTRYDTTRGLPNELINLEIYNGKVYFCNAVGSFVYDKNKISAFTPALNWGTGNIFLYDKNKDEGKKKCFTEIPMNSIWNEKETLISDDSISGDGKNLLNALMVMEEKGYTYYQNNPDILWIGLSDILIRYDSHVKKDYQTAFNTLIRKVSIGKDSTVFFGTYSNPISETKRIVSLDQGSDQFLQLPYKYNSLTFEYAAPFFEREEQTQFSYKLIGFDTAWSAWSISSSKQFTNLFEGEYIFIVKAKSVYQNESRVAHYKFTILPPWYRTFWAYIFYLLIFVLLIVIAVKISVRRLTLAKIKLEKIVTERTTEVVKQKEELQQKSAIIEIAYDDIKSSINYAKRIQESILPLKNEIKKSFPESFVLFKPRDIVSGDFYWFSKHENRNIIACVDCTGHGVPGAFMSMIGNTILNEIINEKGIETPSEILNLLHERVRQSLKQDLENAETRDGMDISLCVIDTLNSKIQYAGANRPLYIIRKNKLEEIKPNKMPIGGYQMEEDRRFLNHEISLNSGDTIYLTTDGYADQFGGEKGKKFMVKRFHQLLMEIQDQTMEHQAETLRSTIEKWQGSLEQVDDILLIGIKV